MQRRRKRPRTALKRSFLVTFSILVLLLFATYAYVYFNSVPVRHLPSNVPAYEASWAKYVPNSVIQVSFQNFSYVKQLNASLPFFNTLLHITNPVAEFTTDDVEYFVAMEFDVPNASVDFAFLKPTVYAAFEAKFTDFNEIGQKVGDSTLYQVADTATGKPVFGWLALVPEDDAVGFAPGFSAAREAITSALTVPTRVNSSILGLLDIRKMLYIAGGANGHIALGINSFEGEIAQSLKTLTTVSLNGNRLNLSRTVEFPDSSTAYDRYSTVRDVYVRATNILVFDSYVRASQLDGIGSLGGDYRLVQ